MKEWMIVATVLTVLGLALCLAGLLSINFDFSQLATPTKTESYAITEEFQDISIDTDISNISFSLSNDGTCEVFVQETEKNPHEVHVKNGTLTVKQQDNRKWYDYIGVNLGETKVVITLPQAEYEKLTITSATGKIKIGSQFSFKSADIDTDTGLVSISCSVTDSLRVRTSTGAIDVSNAAPKAMDVTCTTGKVTLTNIDAGTLDAETTTGSLTLTDCTADSLEAECETGKLTITNTVVAGKLTAETSTGDIILTHCDADSLLLESDTGDISGTLLTEKTVFAETDTGDIDVPRSTTGGSCRITTDTGDITISFA